MDLVSPRSALEFHPQRRHRHRHARLRFVPSTVVVLADSRSRHKGRTLSFSDDTR